MSVPKVGDKYIATRLGQNDPGGSPGDVAEVIREVSDDPIRVHDKWGILWNPKMEEDWTFSSCDNGDICGWRKLT